MPMLPFPPEDAIFPLLTRLNDTFPDPFFYSLQSGLMVIYAVKAAIDLDLAEHIQPDQPKELAILAEETGAHQPSLYLLLRALASIDIFNEIDVSTHTFAHTRRSLQLKTDADLVRLVTADYQWQAWQNMSHTIRTGQSAIAGLYGEGENIWTLLQRTPEESQTFQRGLTVVAQLVLPPLLASYDFSEVRHLVDVGGGHGKLTVQLLQQYPTLTATLFDRPAIIEQVEHGPARELPPEIATRYQRKSGDFFEQLPVQADCFVLKNVLMDWPDQAYLKIISNCARAMNDASGRILVIESIISDQAAFTKFFTLQMAIMMGGAHHRSVEEHRALFASTGFDLIGATPLGLEQLVLEFRRSAPQVEGKE
jgi:hypothetical protein